MEQQETQTEQENKQGAGQAGQDQAAAESAEAGKATEAQGADGSKELAEVKDKYVRLMAEFDNFRRRTAKENFELMASANQKLIGKLTEVLDNFELAFDPKHKAPTSNVEEFEKGIKLIYNKFKNLLSDEGLEELNPTGQEFDPNLHDALMQQPSDTVPENHVAQTLQKGYKVKGKVVKHAKVIVSTGKA